MEIRQDGAPERTVYALTDQGQHHLRDWLTEPAPADGTSTEEIVRKTVAALRTGTDTAGFLTRQRASHLRRMHELQQQPPGRDPASRLAREHTLARLDADLRNLRALGAIAVAAVLSVLVIHLVATVMATALRARLRDAMDPENLRTG